MNIRMTIGMIGSGRLGGSVGARLARAGHKVIFGTRGARDSALADLLREAGPNARCATVEDAAESGDVLFLATPWGATEAALAALGGRLAGKVLIDATVPLLSDFSGLAVGTTNSGGELVAQWAPGARVVKAFNTCGNNIVADPVFPQGNAVMFYCGDDADARKTAGALIAEIGFDAVDIGGLVEARILEPLGMLWITLAMKRGFGREIAFQLLRRG